jgi:succinate dehydrogenase flavin-adding protein (antitoxin of CptAB toxin-antitoxin module)
VFPKECHAIFLEKDIYNTLLHYFELHPFHNILHQKVHDIFMTCLEKNSEDINKVLETDLVKKILDIAKENS